MPFKVIQGLDFGTNRKRVYDFLLVRNSNLGPILHRFGDIAGFMLSRVTPPIFRPNFGGVPVAPARPCWGQPGAEALSYSAVKLFSKNSNLCDHDTWTLHTSRGKQCATGLNACCMTLCNNNGVIKFGDVLYWTDSSLSSEHIMHEYNYRVSTAIRFYGKWHRLEGGTM